MTDPRDLLKQRPAPSPVAVAMPTEVRSDGGLMFQVLQAPYWAGDRGSACLAQWLCQLEQADLKTLRDTLIAVDTFTGLTAEAAIEQCFQDYSLGHYLGTFIDVGRKPHNVRVVFGFEPDRQITSQQYNNNIYDFLTEKPVAHPSYTQAVHKQGQHAVLLIRKIWAGSNVRSEFRSLMLSQFDLDAHPDKDNSPFDAALANNPP